MSLRKSPARTPAMLAANRANALKSTGARTPEGKARAALNGVKHARHARRLPETLATAGRREAKQLYEWLLGEICLSFRARDGKAKQQAERMARAAWSLAWRALCKPKPECPLESDANNSQLSSLLRIRIDDPWRRRGLVFWLQRHRHWTFDRWIKLVEDATAGRPREGPVRRWGSMERRLRLAIFAWRNLRSGSKPWSKHGGEREVSGLEWLCSARFAFQILRLFH